MELWDAYDENLNRLDMPPLIRGSELPLGVYHMVSEVLVRHADGEYLLMRRALQKHLGGRWEATAGGSALMGEGAEACARRELTEETGVAIASLERVGTLADEARRTVYCEFLCTTGMKKDAVRLQEGETMGYRWVGGEELLSMPKEELASARMLRFVE